MVLTKEQEKLVEMQLSKHDRPTLKTKIVLNGRRRKFLNLVIERGVFGSDIMSSGIYLAKFLYNNRKLFSGKICLDMGCGPGTQGLVMAMYGAKEVILSDVSHGAVKNARLNIEQLGARNAKAFESDLFRALPKTKRFDIIVFNHPFFSITPGQFRTSAFNDMMIKRSMLGGTRLIKRFLKDVPRHLKQDGILIMPFFHFAGKENDPAMHLNKYHLKIIRQEKIESSKGLQLGSFSIYVIRLTDLYLLQPEHQRVRHH